MTRAAQFPPREILCKPGSNMVTSLKLLLLIPLLAVSQSVIETLPGLPGNLPFKLETGYIGAGETDDVQLFYYFIESESNPSEDPLMLWLTGGPGCSALSAILYEIGPFTFDYANCNGSKTALKLNPYSWTKVANIIFLDQPAGAGFSYAKTPDAYSTSDTLSAALTYNFLRKWLLDHPKFLDNQLYIGGDSYTGVIVPIIVEEIYRGNVNYKGNEVGNDPLMNIQGYVQGNPLTNRNTDYNSKLTFAHRMALLPNELYVSSKANCHGEYLEVDPSNLLCVNDLKQVAKSLERIRNPQILEPWCGAWEANILKWKSSTLDEVPDTWCRDDNYLFSHVWVNNETVQNALHVRKGTVKEWVRCNQSMTYDYGDKQSTTYIYDVQSSVQYHRSLINRACRALIYSGDHDMVVPHVGTEEWIECLELPVQSGWEPWFVEGQVAGYKVQYSKWDYTLVYATVKGAGHTAPEYKPKQCFAMISRWFARYPL